MAVHSEVGGTVDVNMIMARNPSPNLPSDLAVGLDIDDEVAGGLVLLDKQGDEWRYRDSVTAEVRRPDYDLVVALVRWRETSGECHLCLYIWILIKF